MLSSSSSQQKSRGFKLADPKRISNSIPADLDFIHNIADLAAVQELDERSLLRRPDDEQVRVVHTAVPRHSTSICTDHDIMSTLPVSPTAPSDYINQYDYRYDEDDNQMTANRHNGWNAPHHVYENVGTLDVATAAVDDPPIPDVNDEKVRSVADGWIEYSFGGRPYFFHPQSGLSRWKPPRQLVYTPNVSTVSTPSDQSDNDAPQEMAPPAPPLSPLRESMMTDSADSGLGRATLTVRNQMYGMCVPGSPGCIDSYDAYACSEDLASMIADGSASSSSANNAGDGTGLMRMSSMNFHQQKTIKSGTLDKCKISESGHKVRRKEWTSCYVFLSSAHIIFYKDEKSAEKYGKHYPAPLGVCDLRGARLSWVDKERDKRRKHVFQLEVLFPTVSVYLFSTLNSQDINGWFHALRQVIAKLPQPDFYPTPVEPQTHLRHGSLLGRSSSTLSSSSSRLRHSDVGSAALTATADRNSRKVKHKSSSMTASSIAPSESKDDHHVAVVETRESIMERLRRFFRSRPSIEQLKEKGIYRPEPVFGSTLVYICQRELSLVPKFIRVVTEVIEARGLDVDGLYRVSGNLSSIQKIRCQVDQDRYSTLLAEDDVHVLTGALKLFFRELQEPIFPLSMTKDFMNATKIANLKTKLKTFDDLLTKLPEPHRDTLRVLLKHLARVASHADRNRMQTHNLAIMFGPTLFSNGAERPADKSTKSGTKTAAGRRPPKSNAPSTTTTTADTVQSNSHLAFNMIMQGQIVEYLLVEQDKLNVFSS